MMDRLLRESNPPTGQLASPKPQYKDVQTNSWEELKGEGGASYVKDKDALAKLEAVLAKLADLESELATEDKLEQVRQLLSGVATEAKLEQARVLLNTISNKDFATQATLEVVQSELALIKSELANIKANQLSGDQKVQLSGHIQEFAVTSWDDLPPDSVPVGSVAMLIGTNDIRQTDGEEWLPI